MCEAKKAIGVVTSLDERNLMTTCFVLQFGPVCLAAADTRISGEGSTGLPSAIWDAADMPVTTDNGVSCVIPYRFRKIRQLRFGWAVTAGSYIGGHRMLNLLNRHQTNSAAHARATLLERATAEFADMEALPGGEGSGLFSARLLGVPANEDRTGVWIAHVDRAAGASLTIPGDFAINWPLSLSNEQKAEAEARFSAALASSSNISDAVRAAAILIGSARSAPDSSSIVQIGLTWQTDVTEFQTRYIDGHVDQIAGMSNEEIMSRWEVLPG